MIEPRKESLSALIDGEASEIEVHRLVREFHSDDSLALSWAIYQHIRSTVRADQSPLGPDHHQQLFQRITDAVSDEESFERAPARRSVSRSAVYGGFALAASLVVAVFVGVPQPGEAPDPVASLQGQAPAVPARNVQTVANQSNFFRETPELIELDAEKQRRLRAYLNQHDQMNRMNSNEQLVNYKESSEK